MTVDGFITELEMRTGIFYTQEQREFIKGVNQPTFVFASPGTGKTASAVAALVVAELYYNIPGEQIYALSFTNKATSELEVRHKLFCEKLKIQQRVKFQTLHSLCKKILQDNYAGLGMSSFKISQTLSNEEAHNLILSVAEEKGWNIDPNNVRNIIFAIKSLNSSLVFSKEHVESSIQFANTRTNYEDFTNERAMLYQCNKLLNKVQVSDILLYTLELLLKDESLSKKLKASHKLLLCDEAQDLSLLQLGLVNQFTDCPILIGDQKQQIYGFQGACPETRKEFKKMHPEVRELEFTQSFRCKNEIADFATPTILKNDVGGKDFKGCGDGGSVEIQLDIDVDAICEGLKKDYTSNNNSFSKDILFLYRNNFSALPLIESLYQHKVPFRTYRYQTALNVPFIKEMCEIIDFVRAPGTPGLDLSLAYLIPEFRGSIGQTPIRKVANKLGCSIFDVNYDFRDEGVGQRAMQILIEIEDLIRKGAKVTTLFNKLWPLYEHTYVHEKEKYTERESSYYVGLVNPVIRNKNYDQFAQDEREKLKLIDQYEKYREGVRCYTMHAAKGLEADIVHIIDADVDTIPNQKILDKTINRNCLLDAAKDIRNERSLVYVALTRAREKVIVHHTGELSPLFLGKDDYEKLDNLYANTELCYDDIGAFKEFTRREI